MQSRRILLRLSANLHEQAKDRARAAGISLNRFLERCVARGLADSVPENAVGVVIEAAQKAYCDGFLGLLLFGSQARGDVHDASDTDLLLIVRDSIRIERAMYRTWDAMLPAGISLHISHVPSDLSDPGSLWLECALDARILYDPSGVLGKTLQTVKELILSGAFTRRITHGQGYWVPR